MTAKTPVITVANSAHSVISPPAMMARISRLSRRRGWRPGRARRRSGATICAAAAGAGGRRANSWPVIAHPGDAGKAARRPLSVKALDPPETAAFMRRSTTGVYPPRVTTLPPDQGPTTYELFFRTGLAAAAGLLVLSAPAEAQAPGKFRMKLAYEGRLLVKVLDVAITQEADDNGYVSTAQVTSYGVLAAFKKINQVATLAALHRQRHGAPGPVQPPQQGRPSAAAARGALDRRRRHRRGHAALQEPGRAAATPAQKAEAVDPVTGLMRLALSDRQAQVCPGTLKFFDGKQRYDLVFSESRRRHADGPREAPGPDQHGQVQRGLQGDRRLQEEAAGPAQPGPQEADQDGLWPGRRERPVGAVLAHRSDPARRRGDRTHPRHPNRAPPRRTRGNPDAVSAASPCPGHPPHEGRETGTRRFRSLSPSKEQRWPIRTSKFAKAAAATAKDERAIQARIDRKEAKSFDAKGRTSPRPKTGARDYPHDPARPAPEEARPRGRHGAASRMFEAPFYEGSGKLKDMVALITGGDSGIGRAVAVLYAREGADVAIVYLDEHEDAEATKAAVEKEGRRAILLPGDVADPSLLQGRGRADREGVRQARHPGQQRRLPGARRVDRGHHRRALRPHPEDQPLRLFLHGPRRGPAPQGRRVHRHDRLGHRHRRVQGAARLFHDQGRHPRLHPLAGRPA